MEDVYRLGVGGGEELFARGIISQEREMQVTMVTSFEKPAREG